MTRKDLDEVLKLHKKWVNNEEGGVRADLSDMDLSGMDFYGESLTCALLMRTNLSNANLALVDLKSAILSEANLENANLLMSNLQWAALYCASLKNASLRYANMAHAFIAYADLTDADLSHANLWAANMNETKIDGAVFNNARINWYSHCLVSGLLFRAADTKDRIHAANVVRMNVSLCWSSFRAMEHPEKEWALDVLETYMNPNEKRHYLNRV